MKNLFFFLFAISFIACQQANKEATVEQPASFTLEGLIDQPVDDEVVVRKGDDKYTATVENGQFRLEVAAEESGYFRFTHGSEHTYLYFNPGDEVKMVLDPEQFDESLKFEGKGADVNNYLVSKYLLEESIDKDRKELFSKEEADFLTSYESNVSQLSDHFASFKKTAELDENFAKLEAANLTYDQAIDRMRYPDIHAYYTKKENFKPSEGYFAFLDKLPIDDASLLTSSKFKQFINYLVDLKAEENREDGKEPGKMEALQSKFEHIPEMFTNEEVRNQALYGQMRDMVRYDGTSVSEEMMAHYHSLSTNEKHKRELADTYKGWAHLAAGKTAPNFSYTNLKGEQISLADLKGKNVYVDVWATWCGPCKRELPHLEKLEAKYHGNDHLAFVSVSVDKNKEAWEKMVAEKEMKGIQIIADKDWDSSICKDYNIHGIPRFLLIDKAGKIIDANAPRPSSDEIKGILATLADPNYTSMK